MTCIILLPRLNTACPNRARILQRLTEALREHRSRDFCRIPSARAERGVRETLRPRSAWVSTLAAGLELAKQGEVVLAQDAGFRPLQVGLRPPEH